MKTSARLIQAAAGHRSLSDVAPTLVNLLPQTSAGFESDYPSPGHFGWSLTGSTFASENGYSTTQARSGSRSLRLRTSAGTGPYAMGVIGHTDYGTLLVAKPDTLYGACGAVRPALARSVLFYLQALTSAHAVAASHIAHNGPLPGGQWNFLTTEFTTPATTAFLRLGLYISGASGAEYGYFDDFGIFEGSAPPSDWVGPES